MDVDKLSNNMEVADKMWTTCFVKEKPKVEICVHRTGGIIEFVVLRLYIGGDNLSFHCRDLTQLQDLGLSITEAANKAQDEQE